MIHAFPVSGPTGAADLTRMGKPAMDITLHLGAHRCASTSLQHYIRLHGEELQAQKVGFWGPRRTRKGLLNDLYHATPEGWKAERIARKAKGRVRIQLRQAERRGIKRLVVSDENMIGTSRQCVRTRKMYPAIGERLARLGEAFGKDVTRIVLSIRSQDLWWASAIAFTVSRGYPVPNAFSLQEIADCPRDWRDVITDVACALPDVEILVLPFEAFAGQPHQTLRIAADVQTRADAVAPWLNRSPDCKTLRTLLEEQGVRPDQIPEGSGRWQPFTSAQCAGLRENYADDLHWLTAGADGLARLIKDPARIQTGTSLHRGALTEGRSHENGQEELARSG